MRRSCRPGSNSIPGVSHDTGILSHREKTWWQNSNIGFFSLLPCFGDISKQAYFTNTHGVNISRFRAFIRALRLPFIVIE